MNYYFFYGPSIKKILGRYADLTGRMPLPPLWALGNQQSRWSYYPDTMVEEVVNEYRNRDLPLDVVHLDIDYMHGYRVFTFDKDRFPDPKGLTDKLKRQGVKVVTIVDPGVKHNQPRRAQRYHAYDQGVGERTFSNAVAMAICLFPEFGRVRVFLSTTRCRKHDAGGAISIVSTPTMVSPESGTT